MLPKVLRGFAFWTPDRRAESGKARPCVMFEIVDPPFLQTLHPVSIAPVACFPISENCHQSSSRYGKDQLILPSPMPIVSGTGIGVGHLHTQTRKVNRNVAGRPEDFLLGTVIHTTHSSNSLLELLLPLPSLPLCLLSSHSPSLPTCLPLSRFLPIWTRRLTTLTYLMRCQDLLGPGAVGECLTFSILGTLRSSGSTSESHELLAIHIPNFTLI